MLNYIHTDNMHTEELCGIFVSISYKKFCYVYAVSGVQNVTLFPLYTSPW